MRSPLVFLFITAACAGGVPGVPPGTTDAMAGTGGGLDCVVEPIATWPTASVDCVGLGSYAATSVALYPSGVLTFDIEGIPGVATTDNCLVLPVE